MRKDDHTACENYWSLSLDQILFGQDDYTFADLNLLKYLTVHHEQYYEIGLNLIWLQCTEYRNKL